MKSFERLVLAYLKTPLDPLQFVYRASMSVEDAVNMGLYFILQYLDRPGTYVRILFLNFSSAFNTIIPDTLQNELTQLSVPTSVCQWIPSFLTEQQLVRLGKYTSSTRTISTGALQAVFSTHCSCPCTPTTGNQSTSTGTRLIVFETLSMIEIRNCQKMAIPKMGRNSPTF